MTFPLRPLALAAAMGLTLLDPAGAGAAPPGSAQPDAWIDTLPPGTLRALALNEARSGAELGRHLAPRAQALAREMQARLRAGEQTPDSAFGRFAVFTRTPAGSFWPTLYMRRAAGSAEVPLLDLQKLARATGFVDIGGYAISDDGRLLAYSIDTSGSRRYTLRVMDTRTRRERTVGQGLVSSFDFAPDAQALFYVEMDERKRPWAVQRVPLDGGPARRVHAETDERFRVAVSQSASGRFMQITTASATTSEVHLLDPRDAGAQPRVLLPRQEGRYYEAEEQGDAFWVRDADGSIAHLPLADLETSAPPRTVLAADPNRSVLALKGLRGGLVVLAQEQGRTVAFRLDTQGRRHPLAVPEAAGTLELATNPRYDQRAVRVVAQSFTMPSTVLELPLDGGPARPVHRSAAPAGLDLGRYCEGRWSIPGSGAAVIPVPYVYKGRCDEPPRDRPLFVSVYGAYAARTTPTFSSNRFTLLERGFVVALAQVRGGGEGGEAWYHAGRGMNKRQGIDDFRAVIEGLHARGISAPSRTVVAGASAGGLIVGALMNQAPGLVRAAVLNGPFVDVLATMSNPALPNTVPEYLEWGDPADPVQAAYMASYDPIRHVRPQTYPRVLLRMGLRDEQVLPAEAVKYVRELRRTVANPQDMFLSLDTESGHDGAADPVRYFEALGTEFAFVLDSVGLR